MLTTTERAELTPTEVATAEEIEARIQASIDRQLTPEVLERLARRGITVAAAREHLRMRAWEALAAETARTAGA